MTDQKEGNPVLILGIIQKALHVYPRHHQADMSQKDPLTWKYSVQSSESLYELLLLPVWYY